MEAMNSKGLTLPEYVAAVSEELQRRVGITWNDASGDDDELEPWRTEGSTPAEFVTWLIEKRDLDELPQ